MDSALIAAEKEYLTQIDSYVVKSYYYEYTFQYFSIIISPTLKSLLFCLYFFKCTIGRTFTLIS